jgi:membrane protease YdiL (CAAX protease family)
VAQTAPWLLAAALALLGLVMAPIERRLYRSPPDAGRRRFAYGLVLGVEWILAGAALGISGAPALLNSPAPASTLLPAPAIPALAAATFLFLVLALFPLLQSLRGPDKRRAYAAAIRRAFARLPGFLPTTAGERALWILLSLTAGVCEEVAYRGFLIRFLHEGGLALPLAAALTVSSVLFGLGHLYQGLRGVVSSTIAGVAFGLLFLLTGSLIPGIILHALIDMQMAYVLRPIPGEEPAAA